VLMADVDGPVVGTEAEKLQGLGLQATALAADIACPDSVRQMVRAATTRLGGLDVLVNNAALGDECAFEDITEGHWQRILSVNLDGAMLCTREALPVLKKSPAASIVNIASIQGFMGQPNAAPYATAKGGLVNLTRCMAVDFGPWGIRANAVAPGFIDTRMALLADGSGHEHRTDWFREVFIKHGRLPLRRAGLAADIAGPVAFLAGDDSAYVTGQVLAVDGGVTCTY